MFYQRPCPCRARSLPWSAKDGVGLADHVAILADVVAVAKIPSADGASAAIERLANLHPRFLGLPFRFMFALNDALEGIHGGFESDRALHYSADDFPKPVVYFSDLLGGDTNARHDKSPLSLLVFSGPGTPRPY